MTAFVLFLFLNHGDKMWCRLIDGDYMCAPKGCYLTLNKTPWCPLSGELPPAVIFAEKTRKLPQSKAAEKWSGK